MRDLLISMFLVGMIPWALKRPMVAVLMFGVISIMSPHRYTWGFAYSFPWAVTYAVVMTLSVIMYKDMGISNTDIAFYTSLLYLPWVIKPLWSPVVDMFGTKRRWTVLLQLAVAAG